jgi:multidrug efflux pump
MRVWLDPDRMAALGVSRRRGRRGCWRPTTIWPASARSSGEGAEDLSITTDVGRRRGLPQAGRARGRRHPGAARGYRRVELGAADYDSATLYKGIPAIFIGVEQTPGSNPLDSGRARARICCPSLRAQFPEGLEAHIPYDASEFIAESIDEVFKTLAEAVLIVLFVIFLSLGSIRAAIVPSVAVPLSIVGAAFLMLLMGFSINLLTLLAMVLAIGLVVDDAIVVVENVHRHLEMGKDGITAAVDAARELALPIIAMTTTLVAVYAPIGFMGGLVGSLFVEFAFTLAGAVLISGIVALTLSPMISARVLHRARTRAASSMVSSASSSGLRVYGRALHGWLRFPGVTVLVAVVVIGSIYAMYDMTKKELAPTEDQSILFFMATAPQTATIDYDIWLRQTDPDALRAGFPEYKESFILAGFGGSPATTFGGFKMPQPSERERSQMEIQPQLQGAARQVPGLQTVVFPRPSLPTPGQGIPVEFVIVSDAEVEELDGSPTSCSAAAMGSGKFIFLHKDVKYERPRTTIESTATWPATWASTCSSSGAPGGDAERGLRQLVQPGGAQLSRSSRRWTRPRATTSPRSRTITSAPAAASWCRCRRW